jgi:hypothetical protein
MKKRFQMKIDTILGLFFSSCLLLSFIGGCSAKLLYEANNNPVWMNTVVVAMFQGFFFCSGGLMGLIASKKLFQMNSLESRIRASLIFLFFCIPPMFIGLFILNIAVRNLISLL